MKPRERRRILVDQRTLESIAAPCQAFRRHLRAVCLSFHQEVVGVVTAIRAASQQWHSLRQLEHRQRSQGARAMLGAREMHETGAVGENSQDRGAEPGRCSNAEVWRRRVGSCVDETALEA